MSKSTCASCARLATCAIDPARNARRQRCWIWYLRGYPTAAQALDSIAELALSVATYSEIVQGCRNRPELERLKRDLARYQVTVLPINDAISQRAMTLIDIHALPDGLQLADALIAATAVHHDLTLLTGNCKHFPPIAGLRIEPFEPV